MRTKIKYLENGTFKEMEIDKTVKEVLDYIYPDKEYERFSRELLEDEISIIKKTLAFVKEKENTERLKFLILKRQVENKLKWLLKEIEKEQKSAMKDLKEIKYRKNPLQHKWLDGYIDGLVHAEVKIKKAFSGVIENEV